MTAAAAITPRGSRQPTVNDIGDQQLVGGEIVFLIAVVPDVGVAVHNIQADVGQIRINRVKVVRYPATFLTC
jgi:hypothetical protein